MAGEGEVDPWKDLSVDGARKAMSCVLCASIRLGLEP